ncbi:MAG TPA: bifunctional phosphoribosylaminoimidazolecarboxamide formyltransferase/IMP cyclohydrolase [Candidatus Eremiobacteraceae bacterium]|nr:bifunctional phosphoribosylaminoimidazolecarboxamide formyltransferase/IMP cyclohydrolase [Candidatus Eremiobacteraceae bacterium]
MSVSAALLSLSDRQGLDKLAAALRSRGYRLVATTGTAAAIRELGIECEEVGDLTGFPPLLGGRVKTLHPNVFAGILASRADESHVAELERYNIPSFSVVAVTLYPFERVVAGGASEADAVENIDIGGVTLLRAAAKNYADVAVLSDPRQYDDFIGALEGGGLTPAQRRDLAAAAFSRCEEYDAAIARHFAPAEGDGTEPPSTLRLSMPRELALRYGENPWARAAFYLGADAPTHPRQLSGKTLSYNNLLDVDSCLRLLAPVEEPGGFPPSARTHRAVQAAIVKHTVPCGYAARESAAAALEAALGADPISAFGGIVACSGRIDKAAAELLHARFLEVVAAPGYDDDARALLGAKKNLRLLEFDTRLPAALLRAPKIRSALGGVLLEYPDPDAPKDEWKVVTPNAPSPAQWRDLLFAFGAVRQVKSNAAVVVKDEVTLGVCGGQTNRVAAVELACKRAGDAVRGAVLATDGFFPFADGAEAAAAAGIGAVVAPSGSIRDSEVIAAAMRLGVPLVFASRRYFLH